jgi:hypothetical protein
MSDDPGKAAGPIKVDEQKVITADQAPANVTQAETEQKKALDEFNKQNTDSANMQVHVHSPFREYYNGLAASLSAKNDTGPFDILPHHHNFISLLPACELTIRTVSEGDRKIQISGGIIHVKANKVSVFLDV